MSFFSSIAEYFIKKSEQSRAVAYRKQLINKSFKLISQLMKTKYHVKKSIPRVKTYTWFFGDVKYPNEPESSTYKLVLDRMIRGDLVEVHRRRRWPDESKYDVIISYGDQSHAYGGLLGKCPDILTSSDDDLELLNFELTKHLNPN